MGSNFYFVMPKYDLKSLFLFQEILALHFQVEIVVIKCPQNSYLRQGNGKAGYEVSGLKKQFSVQVFIELIGCSVSTLPVYKWSAFSNRNSQSHCKITWKSGRRNQEFTARKLLLHNLKYICELQVQELFLLAFVVFVVV